MTADLALFKIDWVWPADRLRKQRLDYLMQFISKPELRKSLPIHPEPYEHNRGKSKYRMEDAIVHDLYNVCKIDFKDFVETNYKGKRVEKAWLIDKCCNVNKEVIRRCLGKKNENLPHEKNITKEVYDILY